MLGASQQPGRASNLMMSNSAGQRFRRAHILPVTPRYKAVCGVMAAYPDVASLPLTPDHSDHLHPRQTQSGAD
ncbi:CoA-binding protein [Serratia ureilytica]